MYDWFDTNGYVDEIEEPVCELYLCEPEKLFLRPNTIYRFSVDPDCPRCVALGKHYE